MARRHPLAPCSLIARPTVVVAAALIALSGSRRAQAFDDAPPPAPTAPAAMPPTVVVDLQSSDPRVRVDRVQGGRTLGTVCWVPCGLPLDTGGVYTIAGDGIPPTTPFALPATPNRLTLAVRPGSRAKKWAGWALLFTGGAAAVTGFALTPHHDPREPARDESPVPLLIGLGGLAVGVAGIVLLFDAPTRVTSSTGRSITSAW